MRRRPSQGTALAPELVVQLMGYRGTVDRHYFPFVIASFLDQYLSGAPLPVWLCLRCADVEIITDLHVAPDCNRMVPSDSAASRSRRAAVYRHESSGAIRLRVAL